MFIIFDIQNKVNYYIYAVHIFQLVMQHVSIKSNKFTKQIFWLDWILIHTSIFGF